MRKLFFFAFLLCAITSFGQVNDTPDKQPSILPDTQLQKVADSLPAPKYYDRDSVQREKEMSRNIQSLVRLQKENNARQKKAAISRIAIGLGLLVVLAVGLLRRRKK